MIAGALTGGLRIIRPGSLRPLHLDLQGTV